MLKVVQNILQVWYMRTSFWNFVLKLFILVLALYSVVEIKKWNTDFFQITYFKESKKVAVEENLRIMINVYKIQCLPVITSNKNHVLK